MRSTRSAWLFYLLLLPCPIWAQQSAITGPQGAVVLQQALRVLGGNTSIADVTLTGTARRIAGSDDEAGTVVLQALATGQSLLNFTYPSGRRSELASISSSGVPFGTWSGPDGAKHSMSQHNLVTDSSWFFPGLTLTKLVASQTAVVTFVGQDSKDGSSVAHLTATQQLPDTDAGLAAHMQHASRMDLFLDTKTLLPAVLDFNVHPDDNMLLDIPVEIRFSDYRAVSGVQVPFHVQKYLNNSLILDIQLQSATLNSGLTASALNVQ